MRLLNVKSVVSSFCLLAGVSLTGCSEVNEVVNNVISASASPTLNNKASATSPVSQTIELSDLLGWFEDSCGSTQAYYTNGTAEYSSKQNYKAFQDNFMGKRYDTGYDYTAIVKPDYRSNLPKRYNEAIEDISVVQDIEGVHYYVDFKNSSYHGYDLSRLEVFYMPESDYSYKVLYFENDDYMQLQPIFTSLVDELDIHRGGHFDAKERSITCDLGM